MLNIITRRFAPRNSYFFRRENIELKRRKHGTLFSIQLFSFFLKGYFLPLKKVKFIYYLYIYMYNITPYNPYFSSCGKWNCNRNRNQMVSFWGVSFDEGAQSAICKTMRCLRRNYIFFFPNHRVWIINIKL